MRTSVRPSMPEGSGATSWTTEFEKCSSSAATASMGSNVISSRLPPRTTSMVELRCGSYIPLTRIEPSSPQTPSTDVGSSPDHQLYAVRLRRPQHAAALVRHHRHRSLADDMSAGARGLDRVIAVQRVGQRDIDGLDVFTLQRLAKLVVVIAGGVMFLCERVSPSAVGRDDRGQPCLSSRSCEGR